MQANVAASAVPSSDERMQNESQPEDSPEPPLNARLDPPKKNSDIVFDDAKLLMHAGDKNKQRNLSPTHTAELVQ